MQTREAGGNRALLRFSVAAVKAGCVNVSISSSFFPSPSMQDTALASQREHLSSNQTEAGNVRTSLILINKMRENTDCFRLIF